MPIAQDRSPLEHAAALADLLEARGIAYESVRSYSISFNGKHATAMVHTDYSPYDVPDEYWERTSEDGPAFTADFTENGVEVTLFAQT